MAQLNRIMSKSRITEIGTASVKISEAFDKGDWSTDPNLTGIFTELKTESALLNTAINRIKAESNLEAKDEVRDEKIRAVNYFLNGNVYNPNAEIKAAAIDIVKIFSKYGLCITKESYVTESSLVTSLLEQLAEPEIAAKIELLIGLPELVAELKTANDEFMAADYAFEEEKAKDGTKESASQIKNQVVDIINDKVVVYLKAMFLVNEPVYGYIARTVAQIIEDNNVAVKKRDKTPEPEVTES